LTLTTKSVERAAKAIGGDIAQGEQRKIERALNVNLNAIPSVNPHVNLPAVASKSC